MYRFLLFAALYLSPSTAAEARPYAPARPTQGAFGFAGTILNANSQRPIVANVEVFGSGPAYLSKLQTSRTGTFVLTAETAGPYRFAVSALGYVSQEVSLSAAAGAPTAFTVRLVPLPLGSLVALSSIRFAQSKAALLPESFEELNRLADLLLANDSMHIQLNGHTDNQGDPAKNLLLSENRVRAVQTYLTSRGVPAARLRGQGFGGTRPLADNKQEQTRKLNRRVEFEIVRN